MRRSDRFAGLLEFLAVAQRASFRAAAAELEVTPAAVSQAVRALEARVGQSLFQRTTRSVALTEAGELFLAEIQPAADRIHKAIEAAASRPGKPVGRLRLSVPRISIALVLAPVLPAFIKVHPGITIELDVDDTTVDLAARRYDAGIRIGEFIQRDMVAVRLTRDFRWVVVGSPEYLARRGRPKTPSELMQHECVRYRFPTAATVYRWEFTSNGATFTLEPPGAVTVNDHLSMIEFAKHGQGLAYTADLVATNELRSGELVPVLKDYLPSGQGLYLYFPASAREQPTLRAFINVAKSVLRMPARPASAGR